MPLFPLDLIRNASIDPGLELQLEDLREDLARFDFSGLELGTNEEILEAYDAARPRLNVLFGLLRDVRGKPGADISTGLGFLSVLLARCGVPVIATESDPGVSRYATGRGVEVRRYRIGHDPPPFERRSLDFLVFAEALEHLKLSPVPVLRELASLLRPGGLLLLTTPNIARLAHLEALAAGENFLEPFPEDLSLDQDGTEFVEHVREYSVREAVDAIESAGLAVEQVLMTGWGESGYNPCANPYVNEIILVAAHAYD